MRFYHPPFLLSSITLFLPSKQALTPSSYEDLFTNLHPFPDSLMSHPHFLSFAPEVFCLVYIVYLTRFSNRRILSVGVVVGPSGGWTSASLVTPSSAPILLFLFFISLPISLLTYCCEGVFLFSFFTTHSTSQLELVLF